MKLARGSLHPVSFDTLGSSCWFVRSCSGVGGGGQGRLVCSRSCLGVRVGSLFFGFASLAFLCFVRCLRVVFGVVFFVGVVSGFVLFGLFRLVRPELWEGIS